jgi:hypothetical protein
VPRTPEHPTKVFVTFAAGDVALVRPLTTRLTAAGGLSLDEGVPSGPFTGPRSEIIRASMLARLRRCAGALCLFRPGTLEDEWVLWSLTVAQVLEIPLLRSPLPGDTANESARILADLGAVAVPLRSEAIIAGVHDHSPGHRRPALDVSSIAETLHLMRHPLR